MTPAHGSMNTLKRPHHLYTCTDSQDFIEKFTAELNLPFGDFLDRFGDGENRSAVLLAGSIPLGLGTGASDVDLMVILDDEDSLSLPPVDAETGVLFSGAFAGTARLDVAEAIAIVNGIEIDLHFVSGPRVADASMRIRDDTISLTEHEIGVLSRIKTGWALSTRETFDDYCGALIADNSLEIRTAAWHLIGAMQELEDARAALADYPLLALYLGRRCVEKVFSVFFAAKGFAFLGGKWLRALKPGAIHSLWVGGDEVNTVISHGVKLLFPTATDAAAGYLDGVTEFVKQVRSEVEKDLSFKVAFAMSPQLRAVVL